jgi:hypothetical protein
MTDVLLLFAAEMERAAAFPDGIPDDICAELTGVGLVDAAVGAARLIEQHKPEAVIFAGTCGAHQQSRFAIGDILIATEAALCSGDVVRAWMRFPGLLSTRLTTDQALSKIIIGRWYHTRCQAEVQRGTVSCTMGVTEDEALAQSLYEHDRTDAENLELFSVLRAAGSIPTAAALGVTNVVGPNGGRNWKANYEGSMLAIGRLAAAAVYRYREIQTMLEKVHPKL